MEPVSLTALIITLILAVERIISRIKKCKSSCCEVDMSEPKSPKNTELTKQ